MKLEERVNYWLEYAQNDFETAEAMYKAARYTYVLFMYQQAIEKILKALYLQYNKTEAPKTHSLNHLLNLLEENLFEVVNNSHKELCALLSVYYLNTRYPDYKEKLSQCINQEKARQVSEESKELFKCLKQLIIK